MARKKTISNAVVSKDAMGKEIKSVLFLGAGVVLGSMGGSMLDKMLKVDHTDTRMSLKKLIRPLVLVGAGTIGGIKLTDENMRNMAKGVAMSGILSGVKVILRKDLLSGLDGIEGFGDIGQYDAYGEPIGDLSNTSIYYEPETVNEVSGLLPMGTTEMFGMEIGDPMEYNPILPRLEAMDEEYPISIEAVENEQQEQQYPFEINAVEAIEVEEII